MRFATFLSPLLWPFYQGVVEHIGRTLKLDAELFEGTSFDEDYDAAFICGLPFVQLSDRLEAVAAPVLSGPRYAGRAVYFSDVIVAERSPFTSFADLRGARWCYNDPHSHSGYSTVLDYLQRTGRTTSFFASFEASGAHTESIDRVVAGTSDASAIDSQVLAVVRQRNPSLPVRVVETIGPSPIQPLAVSRRIDADARRAVARATGSVAKDVLAAGLSERFVPVDDRYYAGIGRIVRRLRLDRGGV